MLAAHRDQENLVHGHQQSSKQHPKTPGARFAKTPGKVNQNEENVFAIKDGLGGKVGGTDGLVTPIAARSRAPLGNKTTNAKAKTSQTGGVKNVLKGSEKAQLKPTSTRKVKQKAPVLFDVKNDEPNPLDDTTPEPEYAPPRPTDLPFESDLLPKGGLTLDGLKKENLYRGFYHQYCNPIDADGLSAQTRRFNKEMEDMMEEAFNKNKKEMDALDWNEADVLPSPETTDHIPGAQKTAGAKMARKVRSRPPTGTPSDSMSRKAAVALAQAPGTRKPTLAVKALPRSGQTLIRKPFTSIMSRRQPASKGMLVRSNLGSMTSPRTNAIVSRNTLGYSKGKSASSALRPDRGFNKGHKSPDLQDEDELTITPSRARQAGYGVQAPLHQPPQFTSIFNAHDDEELPPMVIPDMDDDEEGFELKLGE